MSLDDRAPADAPGADAFFSIFGLYRAPPPPDDGEPRRPRTRADCVDGPRPCPWASCRHHLAVEVLNGGALMSGGRRITKAADTLRVAEAILAMPETCALDLADRGPQEMQEIAAALGVTRGAVGHAVDVALRRLSHREGLARINAALAADAGEVWEWHGRAPVEPPEGLTRGDAHDVAAAYERVRGGMGNPGRREAANG